MINKVFKRQLKTSAALHILAVINPLSAARMYRHNGVYVDFANKKVVLADPKPEDSQLFATMMRPRVVRKLDVGDVYAGMTAIDEAAAT